MKTLFAAASLFFGLMAASATLAAAEPAAPSLVIPPIEVYGGLPSVEMVKISPGGTKLAFVKSFTEGRMLIVIARDHPSVILRGMKVDREKLRNVEWIDDDHVLLLASTAGYAAGVMSARQEWWQGVSFEISTGRQRVLLEEPADKSVLATNTLTGSPMVRQIGGRTYIFTPGLSFVDHLGTSTLFRSDPTGISPRLLYTGVQATRSWMVSGDGETVVRVDYEEGTRVWSLNVRTSQHTFKERYKLKAAIETPDVLGFDASGKSLILAWRSDEDAAQGVSDESLYSLEVEGSDPPKKWREMDFDDPVRDPQTDAVIGGALRGFRMGDVFFDEHDQAQWDVIAKAYAGEGVNLVSWSRDRKVLIALVEGARDGASYSLIDLKTGHADYQGDLYKGVGPERMGEVRQITYPAADGRPIPALLTLPLAVKGQASPKNLPLIVLPHGGPAASDQIGFDWWPQALAAQGWAVLQPEFRGSTGFGEAHFQAGFGEWGRKMQTDLSDGVRYLAAQGTIDPGRVAIIGGSYGGYAALAAAAFDGKPYRCSVSVAGIGDLGGMLRWLADRQQNSKTQSQRFWDRFMGAKSINDPVLDALSPLKHIDRISMPILLIHGKDDTVVDYGQSVAMHEALKAAGKPVEMVTLKNEDHWLSRSETRTQMLTESIRFLKACNPPT